MVILFTSKENLKRKEWLISHIPVSEAVITFAAAQKNLNRS